MSDKEYHKNNGKTVTDILLKNKYPLEFINKQIKARLKKMFHADFCQDARSNENNIKSIAMISIPDFKNFHKILKLF